MGNKTAQTDKSKQTSRPLPGFVSQSTSGKGGSTFRLIPLTQGKFAIVDDEDFELLNRWKWFARKSEKTFYATRNATAKDCVGRRTIRMHRVVLGLEPKDKRISDHRNHNGLDNRRENLRIATRLQNQQNRKSQKGISIYKGVHWDNINKKWRSQIQQNYKRFHLGEFETEIEAAKSYDVAARKLFGEFAKLNFET